MLHPCALTTSGAPLRAPLATMQERHTAGSPELHWGASCPGCLDHGSRWHIIPLRLPQLLQCQGLRTLC